MDILWTWSFFYRNSDPLWCCLRASSSGSWVATITTLLSSIYQPCRHVAIDYFLLLEFKLSCYPCFPSCIAYMRPAVHRLAKKASGSSSRWIARAHKDPFRASAAGTLQPGRSAKSAKDVGSLYVARSAHKLIELDKKHRFLKPGKTILDLGASPGGWSQVCLDQLRGRGRVIGVDLLALDARVATRPHLDFVQGDLRHPATLVNLDGLLRASGQAEGAPQVDVVLSDMLGNTSGNDLRDSQNSLILCDLVVDLSQRYLTSDPEGTLIFKIFQSQDAAQWKKDQLEKLYAQISVFKPNSSRKESREVYYICKKPRK